MGEPKLQIEAVLTVPPLKVTEQRLVRQVLVSESIRSNTEGCYQIVVLYLSKMMNEEDGGKIVAGWAVESLGRALSEHPLVAGRLRRRDDGEGGWEILSNDSGVRMVEARIPLSMSEFLGLNEKDYADVEDDLVFWKEVDEHNPEFSPLFYIQVTSFECGGYSIGISCSLLLADFFMVENFLKKWADTHNSNIITQNDNDPKVVTPIFYHPRLKNSEPPPSYITSRTPNKNEVPSVIFKVTSEEADFDDELWRELAVICVKEAEQKLDRNMGENFTLLVKESSEVIRVERYPKSGNRMKRSGLKNDVVCTTWEDFGEYEVAFEKGNKPILVSRWIASVSEGHVVAVPDPKEGVSAMIVVSLPGRKTQP